MNIQKSLLLKGQFPQKFKFCHLFTLLSLQMSVENKIIYVGVQKKIYTFFKKYLL